MRVARSHHLKINAKINGKLSIYLEDDVISLSPCHIYDDDKLFYKSAINILKWQNFLNSLQSDLSLLTKEQRKQRVTTFKQAKKLNEFFIKAQEKKLKE